MSLRTAETDTYDWVKVIIDCDQVLAEYHVSGLQVNGKQSFDEDIFEWSCEEIQTYVGNFLGVISEDHQYIEIEYR